MPLEASAPYAADLQSLRRVVMMAEPEARAAVYAQICREGVRLHTVGGLPKSDVMDALREIGLASKLSEDQITVALREAVNNPFEPPKPNGNGKVAPSLASSSAALVIRQASAIIPQDISWLWPHRIALGKQTIVAGEPGLGKSQLTCAIVAAVTTGGRWPGDEGSAPLGSAIILSAEDDAADTIRPRLDAAGADVTKVYIASAVKVEDGKGRRAFNLQADLELLEREIERLDNVKLVVIDPVSAYLGPRVDSHKSSDVRAALEPLGEMAGRHGVAVLSITHFRKSSSGSANSRFIGSIAFVAAARAAYIVTLDPDDGGRRLFLPTKNNLSPEGTGLGFRIGTQVTPSGIVAPAVFWDTLPVTVTADEALSASSAFADRNAPARDEAEGFLRTILADGPLPVRQIEAEAKAAGIAWRTLRRAKVQIGLTASKAGLDGGWCWALPEGGKL